VSPAKRAISWHLPEPSGINTVFANEFPSCLKALQELANQIALKKKTLNPNNDL
jgi:hypothetical protein